MTDIAGHLLNLFRLGMHEGELQNLRFRFLGGEDIYRINFVSSLDAMNCCYVVRFDSGDESPWFQSIHHVIHEDSCPHPFTIVNPISIVEMWEI